MDAMTVERCDDWAELFAAARRASGMTVEAAASACGVSRPTLNAREADPLSYRLGELRGLYALMSETGRALMLRGIAAAVSGGAS